MIIIMVFFLCEQFRRQRTGSVKFISIRVIKFTRKLKEPLPDFLDLEYCIVYYFKTYDSSDHLSCTVNETRARRSAEL